MKQKQLSIILQEGEGYKIEFKEKFDKSVVKEIVAFANASGGRIFLGINDNGKITGINITNKLKSQIIDITNNIDPCVNINLIQYKNILIIEVMEGNNKPYKCSNGFYLRQGPNSQKLKCNQILQFCFKEGKFLFDEQINEKFSYPKDFDKHKFNKFLELSDIKTKVSEMDILLSLDLLIKKNNKKLLKNAGVLFFSENNKKIIKTVSVICVLFQGKQRVKVLDRKEFSDGIIDNIENIIKYY